MLNLAELFDQGGGASAAAARHTRAGYAALGFDPARRGSRFRYLTVHQFAIAPVVMDVGCLVVLLRTVVDGDADEG